MRSDDETLIRKSVKASMKAVKKFIAGTQVGRAVDEIREEVEEALEDTKRKVAEIADHLTAKMLSFYLIVIGLFFGFLGLSLFLIEYTILSASISFLVVGLFVLVLGWLSIKKK